MRPVEPAPDLGQSHRQQGQRSGGGDERDQHPAVAHRAQERQRQGDQGEQSDGNGDPAEQHGTTRGLHGALDGLVTGPAVCGLLAPAGDHDQRVVDRHAEADEGDQELDDRRDRGELGQPEQQQEGGQNRGDRHHERDERQERGKDEGEHQQRAEAAEQSLHKDSRTLAARSRVLGKRIEAGQVDRLARHRGVGQGCAGGLLGPWVLTERRVGVGLRVDDREGGAPVV